MQSRPRVFRTLSALALSAVIASAFTVSQAAPAAATTVDVHTWDELVDALTHGAGDDRSLGWMYVETC